MTTIEIAEQPQATGWQANLPIAIRFALREMRTGLRGFYIFVACVALGVMVITGVGALGDAMKAGFEAQGRSILGGDVTFARSHKRAEPAELSWLSQQGRVSETATMRTMARSVDGNENALAEIKGLDAVYPLVGEAKLIGGATLDQAVRGREGAAVDAILLEQLKLKVGDTFTIGKSHDAGHSRDQPGAGYDLGPADVRPAHFRVAGDPGEDRVGTARQPDPLALCGGVA